MAFSAATVWEVRQDGSSSNGGGYDSSVGVPGTDYTLQASPQVTYTDMVIDGADSTKFTSAGNPVTSSHVGNVINVTSGTGFTVQRVVILSQSGGVATCDKSLGTLGSTGGNGKLGGALRDLVDADLLAVPGNKIYALNNGTAYTRTTTQTITCDGTSVNPIQIIGYTSNRTPTNTDTKPVLTSATNSVNLITFNGASHLQFRNFKLTHTAGTRGRGFYGVTAASTHIRFEDCEIDGCSTGWTDDGNGPSICAFIRCKTTNCTTAGWSAEASGVTWFLHNCWADGNVLAGLRTTGTTVGGAACRLIVLNSIFSDNGSDGIALTGTTAIQTVLIIRNCAFVHNTSDGIQWDVTTGGGGLLTIDNNIFYLNGGYGINCATSGAIDKYSMHNNAFYNNSSGARNNVAAGEGEITLSADPFTNRASDDYTLNNNAGGGAALRGLGFSSIVGTSNSGAGTGYPDVGPIQHQDAGGGGGVGPLVGPGRLVRS